MRLTLRSLLAYRHGLLSPQEAEELARKIEESAFARDLLERIGEVLRRRSGELVSGDEEGTHLDPNTVAEYLDHVLPPERVPDFERICFESDQQLAEIASCHLILTKVLTEPVQISEESRQRMYAIAESSSAGALGQSPANVALGEAQQASQTAEAEKSRKSLRPRVAAARLVVRMVLTAFLGALALGFGVIGLLLLTGQLRPDSALMAFLRGASREELVTVAQRPHQESQLPSPRGAPPASETEASAAAAGDKPGPAEAPPQESVGGPSPPSGSPAGEAPPAANTSLDSKTSPEEPALPPGAQPQPTTSVSQPPNLGQKPPEETPPLQQPESVLREFLEGAGRSEPGQAAPPVAESGAPSGTPQPARSEVGRELKIELLSEDEVLLVFDEAKSAWCRLARQDSVPAKRDLLSLPRFAPVLRIDGQLMVRLLDATKVSFVPGQTSGHIQVLVPFGHLIFRDIPEKWTIELGPPIGVAIVAASPGARFAVEIYGRSCGPSLPKDAEPRLATLYWLAGKGNIVLSTGEIFSMESPSELVIGGGGKPNPAATLPAWTNWESKFDQIDAMARTVVADGLDQGTPVLVRLRELARHRRQEVRRLAYRALHVVEDFEPLVEALGNSDDQLSWNEIGQLLARAYSAGSPAAERIRAAAKRFHGPESERIAAVALEISVPLSAESARLLVDALRSDTLAVRVLASWRLQQEAGQHLGYRPSDDPRNQRSALGRWEDWYRKKFGEGSALILQVEPILPQ
ncbi:MAG: hypothetical protein NZ899_01930 [Thermoguttaceae bacterium]|nr:hypothetical protein [Thermoguttaceae bacterium]MDW8078695.1 hypothetical protein [Thermoguttaceae bacterium]